MILACRKKNRRFCSALCRASCKELPLKDGETRNEYCYFWATQHAKYQDLLQNHDPLMLGEATLNEARAIRRFYENTDRLLSWIADTLMPRGVSAPSENNFAAIFAALAANGFPLPHSGSGSPK